MGSPTAASAGAAVGIAAATVLVGLEVVAAETVVVGTPTDVVVGAMVVEPIAAAAMVVGAAPGAGTLAARAANCPRTAPLGNDALCTFA